MKNPRRSARSLALSLALAALLAPAPGRAADPDARCQNATAAALSKCLRSVGDAEAGCFKKTGAACLAGDRKVAKALDQLEGKIAGKCADAGGVAAAGYAPLLPAELSARFQAACVREIGEIGERVLGGADAPRLVGASKDDAKCLLGAHKLAGELVGKAVDAVGRCAGKACDARDLDKTDESLAKLEQGAVKKLGKSCPDLPGLVGLDAAALAAESVDRSASAAAAPCDPLDPGHCLFPFPNDYFTVGDVASSTGRRLELALEATPKNDSLDKPVDPTRWNEIDGFSVGPALLFHDPEVDLTGSDAPPITDLARSLDPAATALILDAETGAQQLLWVERDESHEIESEQAIITRVGENLENGRRYLVAFRGLRDGSGTLRPAGAVFAAYRDRTPTALLPVEARRPRMERLFDELAARSVTRSELQLAWDFTTQSVESTSARLLAMRDDAFENVLGAAAPDFAVATVEEPFDANVLRRIDGTFQSPLYLTKGGAPGSELRLGADGLPSNEGDFFTASFRCVVPYAATTAGGPPVVPARPTLYGHGLLGSADEAGSSHVRGFANAHNFVVCGTDWSGFAEEDLPTVYQVLADFSNFPRFIDRQHQGVLNFQVLGRLLLHPDGFASDPAFQIDGQSVIDPSGLFYDGNSQGGILGGVLAAVAQDVERFVLGVPGINYSTLLNRSVDFEPFGIVLRATYPNGLDRSVLLGLAQIIWDRTDPNGHVRHTTSDTYPDTPAKKILYQVAFGDHQVAPLTVEVAARSNGAQLYTPALSPGKVVPEVTPYFGLTPIAAFPFDGSAVVIWDSGNPAPPIGTIPPPEITPTDPEWATLSPCAQNWDSDPHECPRRSPEARLQKSEFLKNDGAVVEACGGVACLAPTF